MTLIIIAFAAFLALRLERKRWVVKIKRFSGNSYIIKYTNSFGIRWHCLREFSKYPLIIMPTIDWIEERNQLILFFGFDEAVKYAKSMTADSIRIHNDQRMAKYREYRAEWEIKDRSEKRSFKS